MRHLLIALLLATSAETLTNDDVIALHKAGLSADVIVQKITTSTTAFDTGATALIGLKSAGVPDVVITAMLQAKPSTPTSARPSSKPPSPDDPLPGPHFAKGDSRTLWNGTCKVSFRYSNKEIYVGGETCRGHHTYQWQDITAVCFTFWEKHPGKPRSGREPFVPSRKAEVDLFFRDGRIVTFGSIYTTAIEELKKDFQAGYPDIIRCDETYD